MWFQDYNMSLTPLSPLSACWWFTRGWTLRTYRLQLLKILLTYLYYEAIRRFYDLFAWKSIESNPRPRGLLARSPSEFEKRPHASGTTPLRLRAMSRYNIPDQLCSPTMMTSRGVLIVLPLLSEDAGRSGTSEPQGSGLMPSLGLI